MIKPLTSHHTADLLSITFLLVGVAVISYMQAFWPSILLVLGLALILRQYLRGRVYDIAITLVIFGGLFTYYYFRVSSDVLLPVLFTIGGIYLVFREYFVTKERFGNDRVEEEATELHEIEHEHDNDTK